MDEYTKLCLYKQYSKKINLLETILKVYERIDLDLDQYIFNLGIISEFLITTDLDNIDSLNIIKEYYNIFSYTFFCSLVNHLSISYNLNGLGYQFINNKLGSDGYIYDNMIKYNTNCLINCNEICNGIGYTKNIATFNNIYTSEFSENIFDDYNLNYYMIQIGNMVFYIDNGSILDVLINEENFYIPASEGTIVSHSYNMGSRTGYTNAWQTIIPNAGFEFYQISEIDLYFLYGSGPMDLTIEVFNTYVSNSVNPNTRFSGLVPIASARNSSVEQSTGWPAKPVTFIFDNPVDTTGILYIWLKDTPGIENDNSISIAFDGSDINDGGAGNNSGRLSHVIRGITPEVGHPDLIRVEKFNDQIFEWFDNYLKWYGGEFKRTLKVNIDSLYLYLKKFKERNNI